VIASSYLREIKGLGFRRLEPARELAGSAARCVGQARLGDCVMEKVAVLCVLITTICLIADWPLVVNSLRRGRQ
jgi:hypothetical protein